jgi:adenylate cyclase
MKRKLKLGFALFSLLIVAAFTMIRLYDPAPLRDLRYAAFDQYQRIHPREYQPVPVRIVDVDENSLREIGQWPWPRSKVAEILARLQELGAAAVAFDILFAEPDRLSPKSVMRSVPGVDPSLAAELPDNDEILARQVAAQPTIMALAAVRDGEKLPPPKASFAFMGESPIGASPPITGAVVPLPALQEAAQGVGDVSMNAEQRNAIVRVIPLFLNDGVQLIPSLVMEALRVAQGASTYIVENAPDQPGSIGAVKVGDFEVPTTREGGFWLYLTPERQDRYVSAARLLSAPAEEIAPLIEGHIVFFGTSAAGLLDIRATPLGQNVPGVSIHAQALEQMLTGTFLSRPDWADGFEVTLVAVVGLLVAAVTAAFSPLIALSAGIAVSAAFLAFSWHAFRSWGFLIDPVAPIMAAAAVQFAAIGFRFLVTDRERRHIRRAFGNYVSPAVLARAENQPNGLRLGGDDREITMMFMDVRDFTTISESLTPTALVAFLNKLLTGLSRHIIESDGTLDKFIGDSIMAFWNAPVDVEEHAARAARCALKMRETLREMNEAGSLGLDRQVGIGIGINTGVACVGEIGAENRFNYSAVGDSVNTTARIESMCKEFGFDILVTGATAQRLPGFALLEAGSRSLKGKSTQTDIFLLVGDETLARSPGFEALKRAHGEFLAALLHGKVDELSELAEKASRAAEAVLPDLKRHYTVASAAARKQLAVAVG